MEGKKSFVLYVDLIELVKELSIEKRGELFTIILEYVNDMDPQIHDPLLRVAFTPIKQALKRDLKKWENIVERNRANGAKGGRPSKNIKTPEEPKKPNGLLGNPEEPKKADNVNENVTDNENEIVTSKIDSTRFSSILKSKEFIEELIFKGYDLQSTERAINRFFNLNENKFFDSEAHLKNTFLAFIGKKTRVDFSRNKKRYQELINQFYNDENGLAIALKMNNIIPIEWKNKISNEFENHLLANFQTLQNDTHLFNVADNFLKKYSNH